MEQYTAKLNYLHIAPRKVRLIADTLRGLPLGEAEAQLMLRSQRAARPLLKLIRSAAASAKQKNKNSAEQNFFISSIRVDQGPIIKRMLPRAMGRATPIHKKMSHVTIVLEESSKISEPRFTIIPPPKKEKKEVKRKEVKPKQELRQEEKPKEKAGFFKRIFRRKAV